jgi:hypothetical protein
LLTTTDKDGIHGKNGGVSEVRKCILPFGSEAYSLLFSKNTSKEI